MPAKPLTIPLDDPKLLQDFRDAIASDEQFDEAKDAEEFVRFYETFLKENPSFTADQPDLAKVYEDLYSRALWLALPFLGERDGYSLYENRLGVAVANPVLDLWDKTRQWLLNFPVEARDEIKRKVLDILNKSGAPATKATLAEGNKTESGTVAAWLRHYQAATGMGEPDPLAQSQYFFSNRAFGGMPPEERETLKRLFALVDRLKRSSLTSQGFEEDIVMSAAGKSVVVSEGAFLEPSPETADLLKKIRRPRSAEEEHAHLRRLLRGDEQRAEAARKVEEAVVAETKGDAGKIRDALYAMLAPGRKADADRAVALMKQLARAGAFDETLRTDKRFADALAKRYRDAGEAQRADDLKVYPTSPAHLSGFLQLVLVEREGMEEADAARVAIQIGNILKQRGNDKYLEIAFLDRDTETFHFAEPLRKAGGGA